MSQKMLSDFEFAEKIDFSQHEVMPTEKGFFKDVWTRFSAKKASKYAFFAIVFIILMAIFAPLFSQHTYDHQVTENASVVPKVPILENLGIFDGTKNGVDMYAQRNIPGYHFFGTDVLGRDQWVRVWEGTRVSLYMAGLAIIIDLVIGITYGLISGYFGGKVDLIMQRFIEVLNSIPDTVIVTLLVLLLKPGVMSITIALFIKGWIGMSRVTRAQVLRLKEQEFVLASKTLGSSSFEVIKREILPNIMGQLIIMSMFSIPNAIFTEAFLAFIGLGLQAPEASLGVLINDGFKSFLVSPYLMIVPTVVLSILMFSFNILADGLRDAFDPTMKDR